MTSRLLPSWLLVAPLTFAGMACHEEVAAGPAHRAFSVVVTRAQKLDLPIELHYPAELQAIQQTDVQPMEIRGYATKVLVDKGDVVKAGQLLARLNCTPYADERAKLEEAARQIEARAHFASQTLERLKPMAQQNFVGAQDLAQAETEAATSSAAVAHARASLTEAQHKLAYCDLTAPFAGDVVARYVDPGALVGPGNPVVTLVDNTVMRVMVNLVEKDIGLIRTGQQATLTVDAYPAKHFPGRVLRLVKAVDARTRTMLVEIDIPNEGGLLKSGMFGRVSIIVDTHKGTLVAPAAALVVQDGKTFFFTADGKVAKRKPVQLGFDDGDRVEVLSGLDAADMLVVSGQDLLGEGAPVDVHLDGSAREQPPHPSNASAAN